MCALAHSIAVLIFGRVIQGVAGGVFPLAFGIIRDTFPPDKVASGLGLVSAILGIGAGIGLPLSGVIADGIGVQWLFWISLIALPAALAAHRLVPPSPASRRIRIDWIGAALLSAALAAMLLGVTEANDWGWGSTRTVGLIAVGVLLFAIWIVGRVAREGAADRPERAARAGGGHHQPHRAAGRASRCSRASC